MTEVAGAARIAVVATIAALCLVGVFAAWVVSLGPLPLDKARGVSTTVVDRNGKLLRAYAMADGRWRLPVNARRDVDPTYLKCCWAMRIGASATMPASIRWRSDAPRCSLSRAVISSPAARRSPCSWRG